MVGNPPATFVSGAASLATLFADAFDFPGARNVTGIIMEDKCFPLHVARSTFNAPVQLDRSPASREWRRQELAPTNMP